MLSGFNALGKPSSMNERYYAPVIRGIRRNLITEGFQCFRRLLVYYIFEVQNKGRRVFAKKERIVELGPQIAVLFSWGVDNKRSLAKWPYRLDTLVYERRCTLP